MHPDISRLDIGDDNNRTPAPPAAVTAEPNPLYARRTGARDITKEFLGASRELREGQLVKDDFFTLFESVGALEIMDPKMDSGVRIPDKDRQIDDFDPLMPLLPEEVIGIMDQMLCYEMAWHQGYPLSQTLFTSLHMDRLLPIDSKPLKDIVFANKRNPDVDGSNLLVTDVLRSYLLGTAKCCYYVMAEITSEHYYEEEDFVTQHFNKYLLYNADEAEVEDTLADGIATLSQLHLEQDLKSALDTRLRLRQQLLLACKPLRETNIDLDAADTWKTVASTIASIDATAGLGKEVPSAFSERVQRHLASNTPPRPMIKLSWKETFPKWVRLCEDMTEAHRISAVMAQPSPFSIMRFAFDFDARKPQPATYSRAVMQGLLFKQSAVAMEMPHMELLLTDLRELTLAGDVLIDPTNWEIELPRDPRHQMARKMDEFMTKVLEEYLNIYRMISQNRCRMRRTMAQSVQVLDSMQAEAELIDSDIHSISKSAQFKFAGSGPLQFYPLAAWAYFHKLRVMEWVVQLGFELEVYLPDEFAGMYCFLAHLATTRTKHLQHIDFFLNLRQQKLAKTGQQARLAECMASRAFVRTLISQATATLGLANALSTIYALLNALQLIPTPPRSYSTPALRHELRMKPFIPVGTPHILSYEELNAAHVPAPSDAMDFLCADAEDGIRSAKRELQALKAATPEDGKFVGCEDGWKREVQSLLLSAIATGLAVVAVRKACKETGIETVADVEGREEEVKRRITVVVPEPDQRYHAWWPVPKVTERKT